MEYREQIYRNYARHLGSVMVTKSLDRERRLIYKYFRKNYLSYFPNDKRCKVLDVGCGFGNYILAAKACGYQNVEGVDGSKEIVSFCHRGGVNVTCSGAAEFLMNKENSYDVIMFNDVIEHLTKQEVLDILCLMKKALKKGGKLIIKVVNSANPITGSTSRYFDFTHELGFTETSLQQVLNAAGFEKVCIKGADIYVEYLPFSFMLKILSRMVNLVWFSLNGLYGRTSIKIFDKNLIAIAKK